jgi:hypothetical protein
MYTCLNLKNIIKSTGWYKGDQKAYYALQKYLFMSALYQSCVQLTNMNCLSYGNLSYDVLSYCKSIHDTTRHCPRGAFCGKSINYKKKITKLFYYYCAHISSINFWVKHDFTMLFYYAGDSITVKFCEELLQRFENKKLLQDFANPRELLISCYEERDDIKNIFITACDTFLMGQAFINSLRGIWITACILREI